MSETVPAPVMSIPRWASAPLLYVCLGLSVLGVYLATMAPSLVWAHDGTDGGDFVTAAATSRVPHPPGFPVYLLISRIFVRVSQGQVARRVICYVADGPACDVARSKVPDPAKTTNLLSAVMATGTVLLVAAALRRHRVSQWAAGIAAATLGLAPWFWSQALITEVYTTAAFFVALAVFLSEWAGDEAPHAAVAPGLAMGLAVAVHPLACFAAPFVVPGRRAAWGWFAAGGFVGLTPYLLLPLSGPWPQPWGDLTSVAGWWRYVTARFYWGNAFALPFSQWPRRWSAWVVLMFRQLSPLGLLLVGVGMVRLWRDERGRAVRLLLALGAGSVYAVGYNSGDSWVYLVPLLSLLAFAMAIGLQQIMASGLTPVLARLLSLALPALLLLNWGQMDVSQDLRAQSWLKQTLGDAPEGAVIITHRDPHTFALWYATEALGWREDLLVVDRRLWGFEPYVEFLRKRTDKVPDRLSELAQYRPFCEIAAGGISCQ